MIEYFCNGCFKKWMTIIKIKIIIEGEKMKKIFGFVLVLLASILLVGCSDPESKVIKI